GRYHGIEEWNGIMIEANVHYYAVALMELAYGYIERQKKNKGIPSFTIPNLRFVNAAVFAVLSDDIKHSKASSAGAKRTYLLEEERISIPSGQDFVKYIHNGSPLPLIDR
ncbi:hypothetical protein K435DRAFT_557768, partial [Dendrothele bispora CBS 962.96]